MPEINYRGRSATPTGRVARAERRFDVRSGSGVSFAPDGRLAFLSAETGVPQVWTVERPGGCPVQRTAAAGGVAFVDWSPGRPEFAYGAVRDDGGEMQLRRFDPTVGSSTDLTCRPQSAHRWGGWHPGGDRFAFAANRRGAGDGAFGIYVQDRGSHASDAELVCETDEEFSVAGWSPTGDRLVLLGHRPGGRRTVHVLDLVTRERVRLTDGAGARYAALDWGPAGEVLYAAGDCGSATLELERLNASTGESTVVVSEGGHDIGAAAVAPASGRLAYSLDRDGATDLVAGLLDGRGGFVETARSRLPDGDVVGVDWGPDGERFVCSVARSGHSSLPDVYVVDPATGVLSRWTRTSPVRQHVGRPGARPASDVRRSGAPGGSFPPRRRRSGAAPGR